MNTIIAVPRGPHSIITLLFTKEIDVLKMILRKVKTETKKVLLSNSSGKQAFMFACTEFFMKEAFLIEFYFNHTFSFFQFFFAHIYVWVIFFDFPEKNATPLRNQSLCAKIT